MAYSSSTRRSSYRSGPPPRSSSNAVAYTIAIVVVLGIVGLVVALSAQRKPAPTPPTATIKPSTPPPPPPPTASGEKPYPPMPADRYDEAKRLVASFADDARKADALYAESLKAKQAGDDDAWQRKLGDAKQLYETIKDKWNDFAATLPSNKDHDEEDVLRHYFQRESGQVQTYIKKLANMKSDERLR